MSKTKKKRKSRPTKPPVSATQIAAEQSVTPEARQHAAYVSEVATERDVEGGMMDTTRMRRLAPVRPLEGMAEKHPKADSPFLEAVHIIAANKYHDMLEAARGRMNHELTETVDSSRNPEGRTLGYLEAIDSLARIRLRMPIDYASVLNLCFVLHPDKTMAEICPNRTLRNINRQIMKEALQWLAVEFGYSS